MDFDDIVKIVDQVKLLEARLAVAKAERDAMQAERDAAQKRVQDCETRMMRYAIQLGEMQSERDAARAGEARAVEALQNLRIPLAQLGDFMYSPVRDASQELLAIVNSVLANTYTQPALDWLAQQRAEAVAAWIEKQVAENLERYGTHYYERTTDDLMREAAAFRAAALRAGEVGDE